MHGKAEIEDDLRAWSVVLNDLVTPILNGIDIELR